MRTSSFSVREMMIVIPLLGVCAVVFARLADIQLLHGAEYRSLAEANRTSQERLPPERGVFLDRYGQPLVRNTKVYSGLTGTTQNATQERLSQSVALARLATDAASVRYELERYYPFASSLSPVLGYTGLVTTEDLTANALLHPRDRVGKLGLEKVFNHSVGGSAGAIRYEVNALGERKRILARDQGTPGLQIETTIDPYLSEVAYRLFAGKKGALIVLNAKNGEVLSLVSAPSFSASDLSTSSSDAAAEKERKDRVVAYFSDPNQVFFNRAISGMYPPGSVFKLVTAAGGLEKEAIDETTTVVDEGVLKVGDFSYANWYYSQYGGREGEISVVRALARSNDIFFYKTAEWLGPINLAAMARAFGFGKQTGIELTAEAAGVVPDPDWKQRVIGEQWYLGNTYHFGIGQGDVLVTPLQVAQMTQAVANRGLVCTPHVMGTALDGESSVVSCRDIGVQEKNLELVVAGMLDACSTGGTAYPFFGYNTNRRTELELSPYAQLEMGAVACKTGTAEFGGQDGRGYRRTHGWFTMALGVDTTAFSGRETAKAPSGEDMSTATEETLHQYWMQQLETTNFPNELILTVLVESDEGTPYREGSRDAAPVAKALLEWMYTGSTTGVIDAAITTPYQGE